MSSRIADLLARQASKTLSARPAELAVLNRALEPDGPRVIHVSGIAGIGKSTLLEMFSAQARKSGASVIRLDCRAIEPTPQGFLNSLCNAIGMPVAQIEEVAGRLGNLGHSIVFALDTYEVFRLMDTWLRQVFIPALPENVVCFLFDREQPLSVWQTAPGWSGLFQSVALGPISDDDAIELLGSLGVRADAADRIVHFAHGHPLALQLAASAYQERPDLKVEASTLQHAIETLTEMFLADVSDQVTRKALEAISVVRRVTVSVLGALFQGLAPQDIFERLRELPFIDISSDGLVVHDVVREAIARSFKSRDPVAYLGYQRAAWGQLRLEVESSGRSELWRYTADMLYLIENPVVREAFFPRGTYSLAVEPASREDNRALETIVTRHEGQEASKHLMQWWRRMPHAFSVIRGHDSQVTGMYCKLVSNKVDQAWLDEDPITRAWYRHLEQNPLPAGQNALFCRRWLSLSDGEAPSDAQAAAWLDLKRTYMEMRPDLRRVYLTVCDLPAYAPVAQRLGFDVLSNQEVELDGNIYHSVMLDFGMASVDGWLANLAADELGIQQSPSLLDVETRELVLQDRRVSLTPLEFGVIHYLLEHRGKATSRSELLKEVWGTSYEGGSNVVDAVVRGLRRKLGNKSDWIETVTGVGYLVRDIR